MAKRGAGSRIVARYEILEVECRSEMRYRNPFLDVDVVGEFESPTGRRMSVPGFHDGQGVWRIRMAPDEVGEWTYRTSSTDPVNRDLHGQEGSFHCASSPDQGFVRIVDRHRFAYDSGKPFLHAGDTCYVILGLDRDAQLLPLVARRAAQGFTHFRFTAWISDKRFDLWPWGGTRSAPDLDRLNPAYFQRMDAVMRDLKARGMGAEIILEYFWQEPMIDAARWTPQREQSWLTYLVSRYAAFTNVIYWTLANEFETYPDGVYRLDIPRDIDWALRTAALVKRLDPFHHPVSVHPAMSLSEYASHFGQAQEIDFLMAQEHGNETRRPGPGRFNDGDGGQLEHKILLARSHGKPVVDAEYGYEWDGVTAGGINSSTDLLRRHTWRVVLGGGHFSVGFRGSVFNFGDVQFDVDNHGQKGAEQISRVIRFFRDTVLDFQSLEPRFSLVFEPEPFEARQISAEGRRDIVVYAPRGGRFQLDLTHLSGDLSSSWLDPVTGDSMDGPRVRGGERSTFVSPYAESVLHLRKP